MIKKRIYGDSSEPGIERRIRSESIERLISFQPNFLREIFSVLRIPAVVKGKQINSPRIAFRKLTERVGVVRLGALDQIGFVVVFSFGVSQAAEPRRHSKCV